jgi:hypothetical protein
VTAIKKSFDYCGDSLAKVQDSTLGEQVSMFGRKVGQSRAAARITIATDWTDHYSTAASYLRLNRILPPTAQPKKNDKSHPLSQIRSFRSPSLRT